jgi:membrane associated rhomboid family serine protease
MSSRYPAPSGVSFGPGPLTPAIRLIVIANVVAFLASAVVPDFNVLLGLQPVAVLGHLSLWQLGTYMFLHGGIFHLLFNMLALWMFGVELERMWGTRYFARYYLTTGVGAAVLTVLLSLMPGTFGAQLYYSLTVGASGAVYGLLLAYGLYFPNRPIYMYMVFPIPAKYFVLIMGAISLFSSLGESSGVAHTAHLGGLVVGYVYLKGGRMRPLAELTYRFRKWKINRNRKRFDVYQGGRGPGGGPRVH